MVCQTKHSSLRIITCSSLKLVNPSMIRPRRQFQYAQTLLLLMILACSLVITATSKPCSSTALQNQLDHDACRPNTNTGTQDVSVKDIASGIGAQIVGLAESITMTCPDSNLFCFRSILPGFLSSEEYAPPPLSEGSGNISWPSNCDVLKFTRCRSVSCAPYDHQKPKCHHIETEKEDDAISCGEQLLNHGILGFTSNEEKSRMLEVSDDSPSSLEIHPIVLDWGKKYLYLPSMETLTIVNRHGKLNLSLDEPYSTNSQFYPYGFNETQLAPGEAASITFVFLPMSLGLSSAQLVLQTSFGGFVIQCKGFALESPYRIASLIGLNVSSDGKSRKNISLFNPFDEALYVEEVVSWISVSSGSSFQLKNDPCCVKDQWDFSFSNFTRWVEIKSDKVGLPVISMRPHRNWEISPRTIETVLELDLSFLSKGKVSGVFCMELLRPSGEKIDTVVVPLEAELHQISAIDLVSLSLQVPVVHDTSAPDFVVISLRNYAPYVLRVVKISEIGESAKRFHIKYMEGLILFPESETQIALVTKLHHPLHKFSDINEFCVLVVETNDTRNSRVKIRCEELFSVWSRRKVGSFVDYMQDSNHGNTRTKFSGTKMQQQQLPSNVINSDEGDEMILKSWKSHATETGLSVLDHHEVLFPVVQVGEYWSEFITVKNPTSKPIIVQLILNSGEIIDKCNAEPPDRYPQSFSSFIINNKSVSPSRHGFSMVERSLTDAFINPNGRASLGPIFFQPSNRCEWSSSLVIRSNLSGVEWLPLRGFGGLLSLVLLEESKPVKALDFKLTSSSHIYSAPGFLCSQPLVKELDAKNTGDVPLEVKRIEVSGTECGLDGFTVENCRGFVLQPGESVKLRILYKTDFYTATIHRDLELALATGIIVIPMKASIPVYMIDSCRKSLFKTRLKKFLIGFILFGSVCSLVFCYFLPYTRSNKYFLEVEKSPLNRCKSSPALCKKNNYSRFATPVKMNGLIRSVGEDESESKYSSSEKVKCTMDYDEASELLRNCVKETALSSSLENGIQEMKQAGNLTVKTGKDKGRRRRRKKSSGSVLSGLIEVSSSHSGNSTPSSPLSPVSTTLTLTPKPQPSISPCVDQSVQTRNPSALMMSHQHESNTVYPESICKSDFAQKNQIWGSPTKPEPCTTMRKMDKKPVLLPSATFPCGGRSSSDKILSYKSAISASTTAISPLARAPGSKLRVEKAVKAGEKGKIEKDFIYDIWGEHILSPSLTSTRSKEAVPGLQNSDSISYFVRGPLALITEAHSESVSCSNPVG